MYCKTNDFKTCVIQSLQIASIFWCKNIDFEDKKLNTKINELIKYMERIDKNV